MPRTKTGRDALRSEIRLSWDGGDPWGSALSVGFAACEILRYHGADIPAGVDYQPSPMGAPDFESYPDAAFLELLDDGVVEIDDLTYWARVMDRFLDLVPEDRRY